MSVYPPTSNLNSITITNKMTTTSLSLSFFLLGLLNNVLYVIILSAALDLVSNQSTPKSLILLVNIAPSLLVKVGWPYLISGVVRYTKRIVSCSLLSFIGILIVAFSSNLLPRLIGISIASFSSGLGEMTYLQLSTLYSDNPSSADRKGKGLSLSSTALGWFASGTGAAGLVGAFLWWLLRGLGVKEGLLICSVLPLCMTATYSLLLPKPTEFNNFNDQEESEYLAVPLANEDDGIEVEEEAGDNADLTPLKLEELSLTTSEKLIIARPLVVKFMLPLFFVYLAEYTINSGIAPTLIYAIPNASNSPILAFMIKSLRDYYPLWQLIYQSFVFLSRSSLTLFHLPPLPLSLLPLPTIIQLIILTITIFESSTGFLRNLIGLTEDGSIIIVMMLISLEGLCGGLAYVNCFYRLSLDAPLFLTQKELDSAITTHINDLNSNSKSDDIRKAKEKEFRIASVGFADSFGILFAGLLSLILEGWLCDIQVKSGRDYCKIL